MRFLRGVQAGKGSDMWLVMALMVCLIALYLFSYTGRTDVSDQLQYFDASGNVAKHGVPALDISIWRWLPGIPDPQNPLPFGYTIAEPNFIYASAPLHALAQAVDGFGLVHTSWLFNVWVMALVCALLYVLARLWGYTPQVAGAFMIGFGTLTIAWTYSQTFYREPLMMVFMLVAVIALERARSGHLRWRGRGAWALVTLWALWMAFHTKDALVLAIPGVLVWALLPARDAGIWRGRWAGRLSWGAMGGVIVVSVLVALSPLLDWVAGVLPGGVIPLYGAYRIEPQFTREAFHTYMFSLGGSWWGTSPVLLLALPGAWLLLRQGEHRRVWGAVLILLGFTAGYALLRGDEWFGGTVWPQRFLLPALPFIALLCLPALEVMFRSARRWMIGGLLVLTLYSLWWQFNALAFDWGTYGRATFALSGGGLAYWNPGFNDLRFIRPVVLSGLIGTEPLTFAWARTGAWWTALTALILALSGGVLARQVMFRPYTTPRLKSMIVLTVAAGVALPLIHARAYYADDPLYEANNHGLHALTDHLRDHTRADDVILINDPQYSWFWYNYGRLGAVWTPILPYHPGDRGSCEQALELVADHPEALIARRITPLIHHLAQNRERVWLVMSTDQNTPCAVRPFERWMGQSYYRVQEWVFSPQARLLLYASVPAPDAYGFHGADHPLRLTFTAPESGEITLTGYTLPQGERYQAGDALALSLTWQANTPPTAEYTVAWFVANADGVVVAEGENTWHNATFTPSSQFPAGQTVWDHRAVFLPDDLPVGRYQIWVRVYAFMPDSGTIRLLNITTHDETHVLRDPQNGDIGVLTRDVVLE